MLIIKIGGSKNINLEYLADDISYMIKNSDEKIIIIIGANQYRNELAQKLNIQIRIIESESGYKSVFTDNNIIDLILMSYAGLVSKKFVSLLIKRKINAISLSGIDGELIIAKRKKFLTAKIDGKIKLIDNNLTGKVIEINKNLIDMLLENKFILVISQPVITAEGEIVNVDNEQLIYFLAKEYKPTKIIMVIDKPGILKNINDENSLIRNFNLNDIDKLLNQNLTYGFKKKLLNIKNILTNFDSEIFITDGRIKNCIQDALNKKIGTFINK
ncbi:MAG: acetylglutamate kinase [Candidatus Parcubacteria bacterium]|nr:MAG: acetylglutamate kinase [Candidatus Parcubacteria bacterium]